MTRQEKIMKIVSSGFDGVKLSLRTSLKDIKRQSVYDQIMLRIGCNEFKWKMPENVLNDIPSNLIEESVNCGCAVFYKVPEIIQSVNSGMYTVTPVDYVDILKNNRTADHFITTGSDYSLEDTQIDKYVIIKNNDFLFSEYDVSEWFSNMLMLTDKAETALIKWSRMHPVAKASSGIELEQLKNVLQDVFDGTSDFGIINDNTKIITKASTSKDDSVLDLTDINAVEKMHFLSEFHYELIRRICNIYNLPFHTTAKSAQNLDSEIHNTDIFSQIISENRLECRKRAAKEITEVFGFDCSVDYSETYKKENAVIDDNASDINTYNNKNVSRETSEESETEVNNNE